MRAFLLLQLLGCVLLTHGLSMEELVDCRADITFVLDSSGSVRLANWEKMLEFVWQFAGRVPFGQDMNHFGVVVFGNEASVEISLSDYVDYERYKSAVQVIRYKDENTNTADGIRKLRSLYGEGKQGDRKDVPNIGIILSDGVATRETMSTLTEASAARFENIQLFGIGIGEQLDMSELIAIVNDPERVFTTTDFDDLLLNVDNIVGVACKAVPVSTPAPLDPCYRRDIALVLDASGSIGEENWKIQKEFVKSAIQRMVLGSEYSQVALMTFSTESFVKLKLGETNNKDEILALVDDLQLIKQRTNVSGAIKTLYEKVFVPEFDRPSAENVAVIFTDGKSNTDVKYLPYHAAQAKKNVRIFGVGVGKSADTHELSTMASYPLHKHILFVNEFEDLTKPETLQMMFDNVCMPRYPDKEAHIDPEACYSDIIFAIDSSDALSFEEFQEQKEMVKSLAKNLGKCLYGVVVMGRQGYVAVPFDSYESVDGFLFKVDQLPFNPEPADYALSLESLGTLLANRPEYLALGRGRARGIRGIRGVRGIRMYNEFGRAIRAQSVGYPLDFHTMMVVITKGMDVSYKLRIEQTVLDLENNYPDLGIMTIGVGKQVNLEVMKTLSSKPSSFFVVKEDSFKDALEKIHSIAVGISFATSVIESSCSFEKIDEEGGVIPDGEEICDGDLIQGHSDDAEWLIGSGETPSKHTGPKRAANGTYYAYVEASLFEAGKRADLRTPPLDATMIGVSCCMSFFYNMHGWHTGKLEVFEKNFFDRSERIIWRMFGPQGQDWKFGMVEILGYEGLMFGLRAVQTGEFSGDIAIDGVSVHMGGCPLVKQFSAEDSQYHWDL